MIVRIVAVTLMVAAVALAGLAADHALPPQFRFISRETTLQQVVDRVGAYTRVRGSGIQAFEFDLKDGSAVLVFPEYPFQLHCKIRSVQFYPKKEQIDIFP
jgi:hypothetical protein